MIFLYRYIGVVLLTVILITACQVTVPNRHNLKNVPPSIDCRVVEHADGETTICGKPRVGCNQLMNYIEIGYSWDSVRLLEEIGFQPVLLENVERKPGVRPTVTIETLSQLEADIIIVHTWLDNWDDDSTYKVTLEALRQTWAKNPLLHDSRAWKEGRVYFS